MMMEPIDSEDARTEHGGEWPFARTVARKNCAKRYTKIQRLGALAGEVDACTSHFQYPSLRGISTVRTAISGRTSFTARIDHNHKNCIQK